MSPRPRTVDDSTILEAAVRVLGRTGPEGLTLADVGAEAGLSAATLVQRFGSKRELLLSLLKFASGNVTDRFDSASARHESPLEALFAGSMDRIGAIDSPAILANRLAFLLASLADPEFRALAQESSSRALASYKDILEGAVAAGELADEHVDTAQLAETIYALHMGSLVIWAMTGEGSVRAQISRDLDVLLRPYRAASLAGTSSSDPDPR